MVDSLRLLGLYALVSLRSQMQYRASYIMLSVGQFLSVLTEFGGILVLFVRFGSLRGWSLEEVGLLYGIANIAFAIAEGTARGFDRFSGMIKSGDFDRIMLRPRSTVLQIAGTDLQFLRAGRLLQGIFVLAWACLRLQVHWTPARLLLLMGSILSGSAVFYGLFILQATLCFWTIETLEIMNTVTYGGTETAQYPLTIYRPGFRAFFIYVIPLACMNYLPASGILNNPQLAAVSGVARWGSLATGPLFLFLSLQAWRLGVRRYHSSGS